MRILVASDRVGASGSLRAGRLIAEGWPGEQTDVVPVGESGRGFVEAYADGFGGSIDTAADAEGVATWAETRQGSALAWEPSERPPTPIPYDATSAPLGRSLRRVLERRPARVLVDLAGPVVHDAGAGLLAALGATADVPLDRGIEPLSRLSELDLSPARALLGEVELVGVVPESQLTGLLLGLRGITSRLGRAHDEDPARMLAVDGSLERFARWAGPDVATAAGSGACGGLGFAVLALGGRLVTGPSVTLDTPRPGPRPDLVLTGCSVFDFAHRGGGVVAAAGRLAIDMLAPCVVLAGEVYVGAREMRAMGIEAAYAVHPGSAPGSTGRSPTEAELSELARRVARTWRW